MNALRDEAEAFTQAARWTDRLVRDLPPSAWNGPGLGGWSMRALVGHTSRALLTVEQYLDRSADEVRAASAADYYAQSATAQSADAGAVLQRGIDAGDALGDDPVTAFHAIVNRVTQLVATAPDRTIETIVGGMRLSDYLPTRTFELVVHGLDIAGAAHLSPQPPEAALRRALDLATTLAIRSGTGPGLLLALTGRENLADGYSVLP